MFTVNYESDNKYDRPNHRVSKTTHKTHTLPTAITLTLQTGANTMTRSG